MIGRNYKLIRLIVHSKSIAQSINSQFVIFLISYINPSVEQSVVNQSVSQSNKWFVSQLVFQ